MATYTGIMSAEYVDSYGIVGQTAVFIEIPDTATLAQIATDVASFATDTAALSQGSNPKVTVRLDFPGHGGSAAGDIEKGALFNFSNDFDVYSQGILVPDVNPAILNANGLVDLTNASVTTWITWITTAHTAITVITKGVRALTALRDALVTFRKHRKPLSRKTKEI